LAEWLEAQQGKLLRYVLRSIRASIRASKTLSSAVAGLGIVVMLACTLGIYLGIEAELGWLAIWYGALGISMGAAGAAAYFAPGPLKSALLGWFLVGLASREILEMGSWLLWVSVPVAAGLLWLLAVEISRRRSWVSVVAAIGGAVLALSSLVILNAEAPSFPLLCDTKASFGYNYPPPAFSFADVIISDEERCLQQRALSS
jgi:hypothetical protein